MPDQVLSNEDKTLEEVIAEDTRVLSDVEVSEDARSIIAGAMITGKLKELRIDDQHLGNRAQLAVERDIFRRQTVIKLVGAERAWEGGTP